MPVIIRSETPKDYTAIAEVNALAFGVYLEAPIESSAVAEVMAVAALRDTLRFDPALSLVAEVDGQVVGHALFYPYTVMVDGQKLRAVALGPIAVLPDYQKAGLGGQMIQEGHLRAVNKGFIFSFLLGHDTYYPRFGYRTHMFGSCLLEVKTASIPTFGNGLEACLVQPSHLPALQAMWDHWFHDVDLAMAPSSSILDWQSRVSEITAYTVMKNGEILGYLRYPKNDPANPKLFLARDSQAALLILGHLKHRLPSGSKEIHLPLHPEAIAVAEDLPVPFEAKVQSWSAGMIYILDPGNEAIRVYCDEVAAGERTPGLIIYPPSIEFA